MIDDKSYSCNEIMGLPVIKQSDFNALLYHTVVAISDSKKREKVVQSLPEDTIYTKIIHNNSLISKWVEIGEGAIISAGVILTHNITIGIHAHLNLQTTIGHDCKIGNYFTSAPGVKISGNCIIGDNVYLGTNSCLKQGIEICDNVVVGMGAVVVKDLSEPGVYVGTPARKLVKK